MKEFMEATQKEDLYITEPLLRAIGGQIGLQFDRKFFSRYCYDLGITNMYSTPAYPQGNGQAETVNKVIVNGLKKRLDDAKGRWV